MVLYFRLLILSIVFLISYGLIATLVQRGITTSFDIQFMQWIHQYEHPMITVTMKFFSFIGSTSSVVVISLVFLAILYKAFHQRHELFLFSFVLIGTVIFNILLKIYFQRERPSLYTFIVEEGFSFPSGHSMAALSLYGIIGFLLWRHITKHLISCDTLHGYCSFYITYWYESNLLRRSLSK